MINKKGISPLIAWMLLISISVAIGFFVINWAMDNIPEPKPDFNYCEDVSLSYSGIEYSDQQISMNLTNNGYFTIQKISFGAKFLSGNEKWCEEGIEIIPNINEELNISLTFDGGDCDGGGNDVQYSLIEITIVPWIIVEGDVINCNDRKLIIIDFDEEEFIPET
jgi:hypothetical protein